MSRPDMTEALAAELRRLFAGNPNAVPSARTWRDRQSMWHTTYQPLRAPCDTCPSGWTAGQQPPWVRHAEAARIEALEAGATKSEARAQARRVESAHDMPDAADMWRDHVRGERDGRPFYRGAYVVAEGAGQHTCGMFAFDLDDHRPDATGEHLRPEVARLVELLRELGAGEALVANTSRGGAGYHARVCLDPSTPAALAKAVAERVLDRSGLYLTRAQEQEHRRLERAFATDGVGGRWTESSPDYLAWEDYRHARDTGALPAKAPEVFPKQTRVGPGRYGNLLGLPCSLPRMAEGATCLLDPETLEPLTDAGRNLEILRVVRPLSPEQLARLARALGIDPDDPEREAREARERRLAAQERRRLLEGRSMETEREELVEALRYVDGAEDYDTWIRVGFALFAWDEDEGLELWDAWSERAGNYCGLDALQAKWDSFGGREDGVTLGTVFHLAREGGWIRPRPAPVDLSAELPPLDLEAIRNFDPASLFGTWGVRS